MSHNRKNERGRNVGNQVDRVCALLLHSMETGEIQPGQRLTEARLVTRHGVSRGPLRESLRRLEGQGLVQCVPNAGTRVISVEPRELRDLYQVREVLEEMACQLAAQRMTDDALAALRDALEREALEETGADGPSGEQAGSLDLHLRIVQGSGNNQFIRLFSGDFYYLMRMYLVRMHREQTKRNLQRARRSLLEHRRIVEALQQRDGKLAGLLMRRHVQGAWKALEQSLAKAPPEVPGNRAASP